MAQAERTPCPPQPPWSAPHIPQGGQSTLEEMIEAQAEVLAYVRGIELWNNCNDYVFGLQSARMLRRAREVADSYNLQLGLFRANHEATAETAAGTGPAPRAREVTAAVQ